MDSGLCCCPLLDNYLILFLDVLFFLTPAVNNNYKSRFLYMTSTDRPLHAATPRMLNFTSYVNFYISLYS